MWLKVFIHHGLGYEGDRYLRIGQKLLVTRFPALRTTSIKLFIIAKTLQLDQFFLQNM